MSTYHVYAGILTPIIAIILIWILNKRRRKSSNKQPGCEQILSMIHNTKLLPVGVDNGWRLMEQWCEHRVWYTIIDNIHIHGCYSKLKGSAQSVFQSLSDISKYPEWRSSLLKAIIISKTNTTPTTEVTKSPGTYKRKGSMETNCMQHDVVRAARTSNLNHLMMKINEVSFFLTEKLFIQITFDIRRYWNKEENGCWWLLEIMPDQNKWIFYLIQPVEKWFEIDNCCLTVISSSGCEASNRKLSAQILSAFLNYMTFRKMQCVPLTTLTMTMNEEDADEPSQTAAPTEGTSTNPPPSKAKVLFDDVMAKLKKEESKSEPQFIKRFRNMIEEKKEWYEEKKRKASEKAKEKAKEKDEEVESILHNDLVQEDQSDSDKEIEATGGGTRARRRNLVRSRTTDSSLESLTNEQDKQSSLGQRIRQKWWSDRGASLDDANMDGVLVERHAPKLVEPLLDFEQDPIDKINQGTVRNVDGVTFPDNTLEAAYSEAGKEASAEILAAKSRIASIDIQQPYEQQAKISGGWIYCGLEREVVILRKIYDEGAAMQSYLGKGLIACPPKTVFEALKNPRTRFTYDDMLKKLDTLHEFQNGMKILYWYHEVSQLFKKECRDFCVLQHEHIEGSKYVISLRSVGWPACMEQDDCTRATLHASGWIIEPAPKENKLYSMVTYIVQMELGHGKLNTGYLIEELAAKQPLGIAHLRQYLVPTSSIPRPPSGSRRRLSQTEPDRRSEDTLAVLAAQYQPLTMEDSDELQDYKPIKC